MPLNSHGDGEKHAPSREEIEKLSMLYAIGAQGCRVGALAERLGFSHGLSRAVDAAVGQLVSGGLVELRDDIFCVTAAGQRWLTDRLSELLG